jgi:hypothetical protein
MEFRRDTYAGAREKIDKDLAAAQFGGGFPAVTYVKNDGPLRAAESRGLRTVRPASSAKVMSRCVWRCDLARIAAIPISLTIS